MHEFGWRTHLPLDEERAWWNRLKKIARLMSSSMGDGAAAKEKLEKMLSNNPWGYIAPWFACEFPEIAKKYWVKRDRKRNPRTIQEVAEDILKLTIRGGMISGPFKEGQRELLSAIQKLCLQLHSSADEPSEDD